MVPYRCFISKEINPYVNLALEEYYLKNSDENYFILYRNSPSVVIGKHQNLFKEINGPWINQHNVNICRRISGGGTVYQDLNNLNFSFIINCPNLEKADYKEFTLPIVHALNSLEITAYHSDRNDLLLNGMKISGNAMHIFKNRVLCHGTLLYDSNLDDLSTALKNHPERYTDKAIKSVPSKVTNIAEYLPKRIEIVEFTERIFTRTIDYLENPSAYIPSVTDSLAFLRLSLEKYSTWDWIYSYSPKYAFHNSLFLDDQTYWFELTVEKGKIMEVKTEERANFLLKLTGKNHDISSINEFYTTEEIRSVLPDLSQEKFINLLF